MGVRGQSGQGAVENLLVISVVVIAAVAASYIFIPDFAVGVSGLSFDISGMLESGEIPAGGSVVSGGTDLGGGKNGRTRDRGRDSSRVGKGLGAPVTTGP